MSNLTLRAVRGLAVSVRSAGPRGILGALLMSALTAYLTVLFIFLATSFVSANISMVLGLQLTPAQLDQLAPVMGGWAARVFFGLVVVWLGSRAVRTAGTPSVIPGLITGIGAAAAVQGIFALRYPPVDLVEAAYYFCLGAVCGPLGGGLGCLATARERGFPKARDEIGTAEDARTIAPAIGKNLEATGVIAVVLWRFADRPPGSVANVVGEDRATQPTAPLELGATWEATHGVFLPPEDVLEAAGSRARALSMGHGWARVRGSQSPFAPGGRHKRERFKERPGLGVRHALLLSLTAPGGRPVGVMAVGLGLNHLFLSRRELREYLDLAKQVALSLEARAAERLREREHIARDVHDTLTQGFAAIGMNLDLVSLDSASASRKQELLARARLTAQTNLAEARRMIRRLNGEKKEEEPLALSLERLAKEWSKQTGVSARLVVDGSPPAVARPAAEELARVAREALNNVHKHARATRVTISLSHDEDMLILDVNDDGLGFDPSANNCSSSPRSGRFGLGSMRQRMESVGGTFMVESAPDAGTTVVAELPLRGTLVPADDTDGKEGHETVV